MKIEYDAAYDLLNIEFLANVPIDDSVEMGWRCYRLRKRQAHRRHRGAVLDASRRTPRKPLDLTDLAIVKSTGSDAVRENGETYRRKAKAKAKRPRPA